MTWSGPHPRVTWKQFQAAVDGLESLLKKHGEALDLLLPEAGWRIFHARQTLADPRAKLRTKPTRWHSMTLVDLWSTVETVRLKSGAQLKEIASDLAKVGYVVRLKGVPGPRAGAFYVERVKSKAGLLKAYQQADALLKSVPEARSFFRAGVDALHEALGRGPENQELFRRKLAAAGLEFSDHPTAYMTQRNYWLRVLEDERLRRLKGSEKGEANKRLKPSRAK